VHFLAKPFAAEALAAKMREILAAVDESEGATRKRRGADVGRGSEGGGDGR